MANKKTKLEWYEEIKTVVANAVEAGVENVDKDGIIAFVDGQIDTLKAKAEKAKENAAKKKSEGDAIKEAVLKVVTEELQTIDKITKQVEGAVAGLTRAKVVPRLTQLVNEGVVTKDTIKTEDGRKIAAYKLVASDKAEE